MLAKGTVKLTHSATRKWECHASFDLKTRSEWALALTYRTLVPLAGSASPRLQLNLSIPQKRMEDMIIQEGQRAFLRTLGLTVTSVAP